MNAHKVIRSFQFGEVLVDVSYIKKGFVFTMTDKMLECWKNGQDIAVSDSWREPVMVAANHVRAFMLEQVEVETNIARNQ